MKESLYKRIARELAQQIAVGTFAPGSLFPTEMELCETWQVSRHTMREALRELTEQGLISRRKGAGTRVCEPKANGVNHPLSHLEDLLLLAKNNLRVIKKIDEIVADIELSARFPLAAHCQHSRRCAKPRRANLLDGQLCQHGLRQTAYVHP